ncbi:MAG: trypsin-like peptidase domain-containing protein [Betaproteobacteria bacterium]|nr:trypsin-like peptidase domain-containing protein [Betaproteobacteria bacterium]
MRVDSTAKRLLFSTVRVDTVLDDGSQGSGTAFILRHHGPLGPADFVVTNRHLVEGVREGALVFTQARRGVPLLGCRFELRIEEFPAAWFVHPDPDIDLAVVPLEPLRRAAAGEGVELYIEAIDGRLIPDAPAWDSLDALEEVLFVGYPSGVWDQVNLMPILRRGSTATPAMLDFEGRRQFLIDAAVYPGSSGSPVFIERGERRMTRRDAPRELWFAGVVSAVFFREEARRVVPAPIPASLRAPELDTEMIDLGLVLKSDLVLELVQLYLRRWKA